MYPRRPSLVAERGSALRGGARRGPYDVTDRDGAPRTCRRSARSLPPAARARGAAPLEHAARARDGPSPSATRRALAGEGRSVSPGLRSSCSPCWPVRHHPARCLVHHLGGLAAAGSAVPAAPAPCSTHAVPVAAQLVRAHHPDLHLLPGSGRAPRPRPPWAPTAAPRSTGCASTRPSSGPTPSLGLRRPLHAEHGGGGGQAGDRPQRPPGRPGWKTSASWRRNAATRFADLDEVDVLVTDDGSDELDRKELEGAGVTVVVA